MLPTIKLVQVITLVASLFCLLEAVVGGRKPFFWNSKKFHEYEEILRSTDQQVGFSETFIALRKIRFEIKQAGKSSQVNKLYFQMGSVQELLDVFEEDLNHCSTVFSKIEKLSQEYRECTANLVPYLEECTRLQKEFCKLLDQDEYLNSKIDYKKAMDSLYGRIQLDFDTNQQALAKIESQLSEAEQHFGDRLLDEFSALKVEIKELRGIADRSEYGCNFVFADISKLSEKYHDKPNVLKYLQDCKNFQGDFCSGLQN